MLSPDSGELWLENSTISIFMVIKIGNARMRASDRLDAQLVDRDTNPMA
jgi:hypothetical protein